MKTVVTPEHDAYSELHFNISLYDDSIEEPDEYFLLVLDIQQPDVVNVASERRCMRLTITDEDSKPHFYDCWGEREFCQNISVCTVIIYLVILYWDGIIYYWCPKFQGWLRVTVEFCIQTAIWMCACYNITL